MKYRPRLSNLMNLGETNYMLVLRLLADKEHTGEVRAFFINDTLSYRIEVLEVTRYTSLINIAQVANHSCEKIAKILRPVMSIRLYHDARMVEIISSQNIARVKPRYDYPNQDMHQPDEKQQTLIFLKEWLQLCLKHGQVKVQPSLFT
ncbi:MAG: DUF1249 domain-containing protein [Thalassotalea sp.]